MDVDSEIYEVKLIGKTYQIDKNILIKIPIFKTWFECIPNVKTITINRSSLLFDHVLAYVIDDTYPYPLKYSHELDNYEIIYDRDKLYDPHKYSKDKLELLVTHIEEINELSKKIYELETKIENISGNIYQHVSFDHVCYHENCKFSSNDNLFCNYHKDKFIHTCCFNYNGIYCNNLTDNNYCLEHFDGQLCNNKNCGNFKIRNNEFCFIHYK